MKVYESDCAHDGEVDKGAPSEEGAGIMLHVVEDARAYEAHCPHSTYRDHLERAPVSPLQTPAVSEAGGAVRVTNRVCFVGLKGEIQTPEGLCTTRERANIETLKAAAETEADLHDERQSVGVFRTPGDVLDVIIFFLDCRHSKKTYMCFACAALLDCLN